MLRSKGVIMTFKKTTINLRGCCFQQIYLNKGKYLFRLSKYDSKLQPDNSLIHQGRFNKDKEYGFYLGFSKDSCVYEKLSNNNEFKSGYMFKYELLQDIVLLDLNRWSYRGERYEGNKNKDFSNELKIIKQHVNCPQKKEFGWIYSSTNKIAQYAKDLGYHGILYQSAVAFSLNNSNKVYADPYNLLNLCLFKTPEECKLLLYFIGKEEYGICEREQKNANNVLEDEAIISKMFAMNQEEEINSKGEQKKLENVILLDINY